MADATQAEMALRSFAIDLLALCDELGVAAIQLYADGEDSEKFVSGCAYLPNGGGVVASFAEFMGGDESDGA